MFLKQQRAKPLPPRPESPVDYPDGVIVEAEERSYYIRGGKRYRLFSDRARDSWGLRPIRSSEAAVKHIPLARSPLGFRDGTLIHNLADGKVYLVSGNKRRHITSPDVFVRFGWTRGEALVVSDEETQLHQEGDPLT